MNRSFGIIIAASIAATAPWLIAPAAAAPISSLTDLRNTMTSSVETVQYRHGGYRGRGIGGVGLGLAAGAPDRQGDYRGDATRRRLTHAYSRRALR